MHAQDCDNLTELQDTRMAIAPKWRSQVSITPVTFTAGQMYEEHHYTAISDSQFAGSHRGRKRLSREATLRTVLALEWLELV